MPDFWTHNLIGEKLLNTIDSQLEKKLNNNYFFLGCQGPDIFFYEQFSVHTDPPNIGELIHQEATVDVFKTTFKYLKENYNEKLFSYICGWILHYVVDKNCHPYIDSKALDHKVLEADIDTYLIDKYKNQSIFELSNTKMINAVDATILMKLYQVIAKDIYGKEFNRRNIDKSLQNLKLFQKIFNNEKLMNKIIVKLIEWIKKDDLKKYFYRSKEKINIPEDIKDFEYTLFLSIDEALDKINDLENYCSHSLNLEYLMYKYEPINYSGEKIVST